jgi:hypothetical protein
MLGFVWFLRVWFDIVCSVLFDLLWFALLRLGWLSLCFGRLWRGVLVYFRLGYVMLCWVKLCLVRLRLFGMVMVLLFRLC